MNSVARDLRKLGHAAAVRGLLNVERRLASEGHQGEALSGEFAGLYTLRVGDDRVIYARTEKGFLVLRIGHEKFEPARAEGSQDVKSRQQGDRIRRNGT